MGFFHPGIPDYLIEWGRLNLPSSRSVETGTYLGDSALLLADAFGRCTTIEKDPDLARKARVRFADDPRVVVMEGSSRELLGSVLESLETPPFVWLDAHWSGGITAGSDDPCPVMAEIDAVTRAFGDASFIAVDDARIFAAADPNDVINNAWPSLFEVLGRLEMHGLATYVLDDVIVGVPPRLGKSISQMVPRSWMGQNQTLSHYELSRQSRYLRARKRVRLGATKVKARLRSATLH